MSEVNLSGGCTIDFNERTGLIELLFQPEGAPAAIVVRLTIPQAAGMASQLKDLAMAATLLTAYPPSPRAVN